MTSRLSFLRRLLCLVVILSVALSGVQAQEKSAAAPSPSSPNVGKASAQAAKYELGTKVSFGTGGNSAAYKGAGWSSEETGHTWTDKPAATLEMKVPKADTSLELTMRMSALVKPPALPFQPVVVTVNGIKVADWEVNSEQDYRATIPKTALDATGGLHIQLSIPKAASPTSLGLGQDDRVLGLNVSELQISAVATP